MVAFELGYQTYIQLDASTLGARSTDKHILALTTDVRLLEDQDAPVCVSVNQ